jgi:uncharacterized protein (TIGR00369 family)
MSETATPPNVNETQDLIANAARQGLKEVSLQTNPAFVALSAVLVEATPGKATTSFVASDAMLQGHGVVGGGAIANMLDSAMAVAALSALAPGQSCATISVTVNMLRPAKPGRLVAEAVVTRLGRSVAFTSGELKDADGKLVATATSNLAVFSLG